MVDNEMLNKIFEDPRFLRFAEEYARSEDFANAPMYHDAFRNSSVFVSLILFLPFVYCPLWLLPLVFGTHHVVMLVSGKRILFMNVSSVVKGSDKSKEKIPDQVVRRLAAAFEDTATFRIESRLSTIYLFVFASIPALTPFVFSEGMTATEQIFFLSGMFTAMYAFIRSHMVIGHVLGSVTGGNENRQ